jgi:TPR repeat protein
MHSPQTNLRQGISFDGMDRGRQSVFMRVLSVCWVLLVVAGSVAQAKQPMKWENLMLMRTAAEKGDPEAQFLIGLQYKVGDGVARDQVEAARWLRQSAETGHTEAQYALGTLQAESGGADDATEAAKWLRAAAAQGNAAAMLSLGTLYSRSDTAGHDLAEALRWYHQAAEAGQAGAARVLAEHYARGLGVARDPEQALEWYRKAAELGDQGARFVLDRIEAVTKAVTDDPAKALADWRREAEKGDAGAGLALELIVVRARAMDEDPAETVRWSLLLSGLRGAEAHVVRGLMLENGIAMNRDSAAAVASYRKAAELGSGLGQYRLGLMFAAGRGVAEDPVEAGVWLSLAAKAGHKEAAAEWDKLRAGLTSAQIEAVDALRQKRSAVTKQP